MSCGNHLLRDCCEYLQRHQHIYRDNVLRQLDATTLSTQVMAYTEGLLRTLHCIAHASVPSETTIAVVVFQPASKQQLSAYDPITLALLHPFAANPPAAAYCEAFFKPLQQLPWWTKPCIIACDRLITDAEHRPSLSLQWRRAHTIAGDPSVLSALQEQLQPLPMHAEISRAHIQHYLHTHQKRRQTQRQHQISNVAPHLQHTAGTLADVTMISELRSLFPDLPLDEDQQYLLSHSEGLLCSIRHQLHARSQAQQDTLIAMHQEAIAQTLRLGDAHTLLHTLDDHSQHVAELGTTLLNHCQAQWA